MKRLLILRHAKSSWEDSSLSDFDRPLNERGLNAAPFMGEVLSKRNLHPELIISSPAQRALHTAELAKKSSGSAAPLILNDSIYEARPQALRTVAAEISDEIETALIVGHNPGIEGFVRYLCGVIEPIPTAALAIIDLNIEKWSQVTADCGHLVEILRPKELNKALGV